jgi:hypothetical protein
LLGAKVNLKTGEVRYEKRTERLRICLNSFSDSCGSDDNECICPAFSAGKPEDAGRKSECATITYKLKKGGVKDEEKHERSERIGVCGYSDCGYCGGVSSSSYAG